MLRKGDDVVLTTSEGWESPAGTIFKVEDIGGGSVKLHSTRTGYIYVLEEYLSDFHKLFYIKITEKWSHGHSKSVYFVFEDDVNIELTDEDVEDECEVFLGYEHTFNSMSEHHRGYDWEHISREAYIEENVSFVSNDIDLNIVFSDEKVILSQELFSICMASNNQSERGVVARYVIADLKRKENI